MGTEQKLGIRTFLYHLYQNIATGVAMLILALVLVIVNPGLGFIASVLAALSFLVVVAGTIYSWLRYISCTFILDEHALIIKRGILSKKETSIPYRQIQNINIEQTPSRRIMGVSNLIILTAGEDNNNTVGKSEGVFNIIDISMARSLQESLLERINVQQIKSVAP